MKTLFIIFLLVASGNVLASKWIVDKEIERVFAEQNIEGVFILYDVNEDTLITNDIDRSNRRYSPASTFKIFNSLIALDAGAVKNEYEIVPYGGKPQRQKSWEKDTHLKEAMRISSLPIYQEVARRVGNSAMQDYLVELNYGNLSIGQKIDQFWLSGALKISAKEQVHLLASLAKKSLPFSTELQEVVKDITLVRSGKGWSLHAKTGWGRPITPTIGWWVGWVEKKGRIYGFALNLDIYKNSDAKKRKLIGEKCLNLFGVL